MQGSYAGPYFDGATRPKIRRNLTPNPTPVGVALFTGIRGVVTNPGGYARLTVNDATSGNDAQRITTEGTTAGRALATPGEVYSVRAQGRASAAGVIMRIQFAFHDAAGAVVGVVAGGTGVEVNATTFTDLPVVTTAPAPAGAVAVGWRITRSSGPVTIGDTIDARNIIVERGATVGPYFDGSIAPVGPYASTWEGAANASPSYTYDPDLTNSWTGTANASASTLTGAGVAGTNNMLTLGAGFQSGQWARSGTKSIRVTALSASNDSFVNIAPMLPSPTTLLGKTVTIRAVIRLLAAQTGTLRPDARRFSINCTGAAVQPTLTYTSQATNAAGVYLVSATFVVPSDATSWGFVRLYNGAAAGNSDVFWDELMLVQGAYTGPYFDGSTPAAEGHGPASWTGAPHASTSKLWGMPTP